MTNFLEHYKQVRARLNRGAQIKKIEPPRFVDDYVMPRPQPEMPETQETLRMRRLNGCPLSMRRKLIVLPVLEEFDLTWEKLVAKDRRVVMQEPRRKVWLKLWEDGMSMKQIGIYTQRDHSTVIHGLRAIKKAQSEDKACTTATR